MFPEPTASPDQPAKYIVIYTDLTRADKGQHYPPVHMFQAMSDALDFINGKIYPNEWTLFQAVKLEEKQITVTRMVVKQ